MSRQRSDKSSESAGALKIAKPRKSTKHHVIKNASPLQHKKTSIKLKLCDFWPGFRQNDFRLLSIIKNHFEVEISDQPDYVIYSNWGSENAKHNCVKVHFTGENIRTSYKNADFSVGFDYSNDERHLRYPLYVEYRDAIHNENFLEAPFGDAALESELKEKTKFCCFIVSNGKCEFRNEFFRRLSTRRHVDSGGAFLNNIGGRVQNKLEFMKSYKFAIAFESAACGGYTTEKILQPYYSRTIPIYWGNPKIDDEFDPRSFIWVKDPDEVEQAIDRILELAENPQNLGEMIARSPFYGRRRNLYYSEERVAAFFERVFAKKRTSVAATARYAAAGTERVRRLGQRAMNRLTRRQRP